AVPQPAPDTQAISAARAAVAAAQQRVDENQRLVDQIIQTSNEWSVIENKYLDQLRRTRSRLDRDELTRRYLAASQPLEAQFKRRQQATARLTKDQIALRRKQAVLAGLTGGMQGADEPVLPMPWVATDGLGLSVLGGVLAFAWSPDTPVLLDSATG